MTEQEIINYLKENKNKGVAFNFMPEEMGGMYRATVIFPPICALIVRRSKKNESN